MSENFNRKMNDYGINCLANDVMAQADKLFPDRTDQSMFLKMYGELGELAGTDDPAKRADEFADVMIMLLDFGARHDIDIKLAVQRKMAINQNRKWVQSKLGVMQHVD